MTFFFYGYAIAVGLFHFFVPNAIFPLAMECLCAESSLIILTRFTVSSSYAPCSCFVFD